MTVRALGDLATISNGLVTSGAGAGSRPGDWRVLEISLRDIVDDRLRLDSVDFVDLERKLTTEKHLLRPFDILVTARSTIVKAALVPPSLQAAVANSTLAVVRPKEPDMAPWLWWFLTSRRGRAELEARMVGTTVLLLRTGALRDVPVLVPPRSSLRRLTELIEASEVARTSALAAIEVRHSTLRDAVVEDLLSSETPKRTLAQYRQTRSRSQNTDRPLPTKPEAAHATH